LPDNAWRRFLLGDFVLSYLALEGEEQNEYDRLMSTAPYQGARTMAVSIVDQAIEKGILEGKRTLLLRQLAKQYGPPGEPLRLRLQTMTAEQLDTLAEAVLERKSLKDLGLSE